MAREVKALIEKLDPVCRKALEEAAALCVSQTHFSVEVEHLLVKLTESTSSDWSVVLRYYDVATTDVVKELTRALEGFKRGSGRTPAFAPQLIDLLERGWMASSVQLGAPSIRSAGLLSALLEDETTRAIVVESCPSLTSIPLERLREDLPELIRHSEEGGGDIAVVDRGLPSSGPEQIKSPTPALDQYTLNLTAEVRAGRIDPIRSRDREIRLVIDILTRRRQNNPILVGEAGVGKTAIAEGFALKVVADEVPSSLQGVSVRILDLGLLQAGAGIKGEFEDRLKKVIEEVRSNPKPVILFIDEAHTMIGAGGQAGQGDAANLLKPALARGELRTIAATTWAEYKKYFEKDPALTRRFQLIRVDEPEEEAAIDMLRGIVPKLEEHHGVRILDAAVGDAVRLSMRYLSDRRLPDKAISVLDTAGARVALAHEARPVALEALDQEIKPIELHMSALRREQKSGVDHGDRLMELSEELTELAARRGELEELWQSELRLVEQIVELERKLVELEDDDESASQFAAELAGTRRQLDEVQGEDPLVSVAVDPHVVAEVISNWTGVPVGRMLTDEIRSVLSLGDRVGEQLIGQPQAIEAICKRISTTRAELEDPSKPQGVFLLVGPSGVGKTETALVLADILYGGSQNMVSLNMSEFQEPHSVATLKGSPPGYVGFGEGGVLTEAVRKRPYSVVLLDEVEKAHPDVMELFYQVFDKGILEDGEGVPVDFKNTIILMTANLGAQSILESCEAAGDEPPSWESLVQAVRPEILEHFRPALLGRLTVVPYRSLGSPELERIVGLKMKKIEQRLERQHRAVLSFEGEVVEEIVRRCNQNDTGARHIDAILTQTLLPELSTELLEHMAEGRSFSRVHLSVADTRSFTYAIS